MEKDREGKLGFVFRIQEKYELEKQGKWHSFIDVKAISSMKGLLSYFRAHTQKASYGSSEEAILNCAIQWLYRKNSYSLSGDFRKVFFEFIKDLHDSKPGSLQYTLDGDVFDLWEWEMMGIRSAGDVGGKGEWVISLSEDDFLRLVGG